MNQEKRILSDFEKLSILNRLCKIKDLSPRKNRTNNPYYSNSSSKLNKYQTVYLQKTNPSSFMPLKVRIIKKQRDLNSLSPNSFHNSNQKFRSNKRIKEFLRKSKIRKEDDDKPRFKKNE